MIFITGNKNKLQEAKEILNMPDLEGKKMELLEIQETDVKRVVKEKLKSAKIDCIVEDSGLYLGENKEIGALIKFFPNKRIVMAYKHEKAIASCVIGYKKGLETYFFEGNVSGKIVDPKGRQGFGWDSIFQPDGFSKTFGEMSADEKNLCSQRRKAFDLFKKQLKKIT